MVSRCARFAVSRDRLTASTGVDAVSSCRLLFSTTCQVSDHCDTANAIAPTRCRARLDRCVAAERYGAGERQHGCAHPRTTVDIHLASSAVAISLAEPMAHSCSPTPVARPSFSNPRQPMHFISTPDSHDSTTTVGFVPCGSPLSNNDRLLTIVPGGSRRRSREVVLVRCSKRPTAGRSNSARSRRSMTPHLLSRREATRASTTASSLSHAPIGDDACPARHGRHAGPASRRARCSRRREVAADARRRRCGSGLLARGGRLRYHGSPDTRRGLTTAQVVERAVAWLQTGT